MEQILEHIHANRGENNTQSDDFDQHKLQQSEEGGIGASDDEEDQSEQPSKQKRLQIMVFSATLTLPLHLRRRLNKSKYTLHAANAAQEVFEAGHVFLNLPSMH